MNVSQLCVTDFKIVWNNSGVNTICPICGDGTDPSINFQIQTQGGDAICETCLIEKATDLAEVLYAYFVYKHPNDDMTKLFLAEIKQQQIAAITKPKVVSFPILEELAELTDGIMLRAFKKTPKRFLVTKKWLAVNEPAYADFLSNSPGFAYEALNESAQKSLFLYQKALKDGAIIAESH